MTKDQLIEKLSEIINTQEKLDALESLINERLNHWMYSAIDAGIVKKEEG